MVSNDLGKIDVNELPVQGHHDIQISMYIHGCIDVYCQPRCEEIEPCLIWGSKIGMHVVRNHHQQLPGVQGQPVFHDI